MLIKHKQKALIIIYSGLGSGSAGRPCDNLLLISMHLTWSDLDNSSNLCIHRLATDACNRASGSSWAGQSICETTNGVVTAICITSGLFCSRLSVICCISGDDNSWRRLWLQFWWFVKSVPECIAERLLQQGHKRVLCRARFKQELWNLCPQQRVTIDCSLISSRQIAHWSEKSEIGKSKAQNNRHFMLSIANFFSLGSKA